MIYFFSSAFPLQWTILFFFYNCMAVHGGCWSLSVSCCMIPHFVRNSGLHLHYSYYKFYETCSKVESADLTIDEGTSLQHLEWQRDYKVG